MLSFRYDPRNSHVVVLRRCLFQKKTVFVTSTSGYLLLSTAVISQAALEKHSFWISHPNVPSGWKFPVYMLPDCTVVGAVNSETYCCGPLLLLQKELLCIHEAIQWYYLDEKNRNLRRLALHWGPEKLHANGSTTGILTDLVFRRMILFHLIMFWFSKSINYWYDPSPTHGIVSKFISFSFYIDVWGLKKAVCCFLVVSFIRQSRRA